MALAADFSLFSSANFSSASSCWRHDSKFRVAPDSQT